MARALPLLALSFLLAAAVGCRRAPGDDDYDTDGGPLVDAGPLEVDSGSPEDAGPLDSGPPDSGPPDSGLPDSGPDAGPPDSGSPEDAGPLDSGAPPVDAGTFPGDPGVASRIAFTQGPPNWELEAGFCTGELFYSVRLSVLDGPGDPVNTTSPVQITLSSNVPDPQDVRFYTDPTCMTNTGSVTIPAGQSGVSFHLRMYEPGTWNLRGVASGDTGLTEANREIVILE